jgi:hypothetical protein
MRTLVFCTAFAADHSVWADRYRPWLDAVMRGGLGADQVLLVDDGSATLPGWSDTHIETVDVLGDAFTLPARGPVLLAHFRARLGRADLLNFPGWHRSFCFAALYAERWAFDRVIHVESDAYVISQRAVAYLASRTEGWTAFWSARYDMPESAIQVVAGEGLRTLAQFARRGYGPMIGQVHERVMPFTATAREFAGDRFGEFSDSVPLGVDYAAQVPSRRERGFYWFVPGSVPVGAPRSRAVLTFCAGGNGGHALRDGWSVPEPKHCWMMGAESSLSLPTLEGNGDAVLRLTVTPHVSGDVLTRQRLIVEVNGRLVRAFVVFLETVLGCDVPAALLGREGGDVLRLVHPDAVAPCELCLENGDTRRLSVSVERLEIERF